MTFIMKLIILLLSFYSFEISSHQRLLIIFHWSLSDSKSPHVSRTLLSILADLYNTVVIIIIIIIHSLELFTSALADGFSLESEWQQVSSSLQDASQYSDCSQ